MSGRTPIEAGHARAAGRSSTTALARRQLLAGAAGCAALALASPARAAVPTALPLATGDIVGQLTYLVTDGKKTLIDLAVERDLGILSISAVNQGVDVWVPGPERLVTLPTAHVLPEHQRLGIIVNLAEFRLYFFPTPDAPPIVHTIGIGRDGFSTPLGPTTVVRKQANPTWYPTESTRADRPDLPSAVPSGPDNPLGLFALYLGFPTYLIHGTNKPYGVGRRVSRGCIRMYPSGVASLFQQVPVGTPVRIMNDPIKLGWSAGELYIEVHPDTEQFDQLEVDYRFTRKPPPDVAPRITAKAGAEAGRLAWDVIERELVNRQGIPVQITRPVMANVESRSKSSLPTGFIGLY
ncbi:MAG: L,D-transpeptidase family protein [Geminicoccaceae bacterium]|nr:L,D-transpeptidase family protein [Geminicoccaceae bacterium]HRY23109.1 L,D-transpeptidase family protein [Geminicoccaceae bacterium]